MDGKLDLSRLERNAFFDAVNCLEALYSRDEAAFERACGEIRVYTGGTGKKGEFLTPRKDLSDIEIRDLAWELTQIPGREGLPGHSASISEELSVTLASLDTARALSMAELSRATRDGLLPHETFHEIASGRGDPDLKEDDR